MFPLSVAPYLSTPAQIQHSAELLSFSITTQQRSAVSCELLHTTRHKHVKVPLTELYAAFVRV
jgi:hypothetical protein